MGYVTYEGLFAFITLLFTIGGFSFELFKYFSKKKISAEEDEKPPAEVHASDEDEKKTTTKKK